MKGLPFPESVAIGIFPLKFTRLFNYHATGYTMIAKLIAFLKTSKKLFVTKGLVDEAVL